MVALRLGKAHTNYIINKEGVIRNTRTGVTETVYINMGHPYVKLSIGKSRLAINAANIMAQNFLGLDGYKSVSFKDSDKKNISLDNLDIYTHLEYYNDKLKEGSDKEGKLKDTKLVMLEDYGVKKYASKSRRYGLFKCFCDTGTFESDVHSVMTGLKSSCGCINIGDPRRKDKLYPVWNGMKQRCYNKKSKGYSNYGARGITVCDEWLDKDEGFIGFMNGHMLMDVYLV